MLKSRIANIDLQDTLFLKRPNFLEVSANGEGEVAIAYNADLMQIVLQIVAPWGFPRSLSNGPAGRALD